MFIVDTLNVQERERHCHCPMGENWKNDAIPKTYISTELLIKVCT